MTQIEITYVFGTGRKEKLSKKDISFEFFYGYNFYKNKFQNIELIELDEGLKNNYVISKIVYLIDRILNKISYLPFYMNEVLTLNNIKKILVSKNLVITNDRIGISLLPILLYIRFFKKINVIVIVMGLLNNRQPGVIRLKLQNLIIKVFLKSVSNFIFLGKGEYQEASKKYESFNNKFQFVPFCVDTDFWDSKIPLSSLERDSILFIGNDSKRDFKNVIEISKLLHNFNFIFVTSNIEKGLIGKNVNLLNGNWNEGLLSDLEIKRIYEKGLITILPLKDTFQPSGQSVALQSMSMGVPVLISRTKGFWDYDKFQNNKNIFFMENNDPIEWARKIKELFVDKKQLNQVSKNSRTLIKSEYNYINFVNELNKLLL